jgi:hypothetical protein
VRKIVSIVLGGIVLAAGTSRARPGENDEARAVVAKSIAAAGGETALAKHQAATWKETGTYYGMGNGVPFTAKYAQQLPDRFRMEIEGYLTMVYASDKGWIHSGGETRDMNKQELAAQKSDRRAGAIASLLPLKDKAYTLTLIGETKVDDQPAVGVKVTRPEYPEVGLFFDKKSHLLIKSEWPSQASEEKFKDVTASMYYSKFQEIDGAKVPTRLVMKRDGKLFVEADVSDLKAVGKLDDKVFARP